MCLKYDLISLAVTPEKFRSVFTKTSRYEGLKKFTIFMFLFGHDQVSNKGKEDWEPCIFDASVRKHIWEAIDGDFATFDAIFGASQIYLERKTAPKDPRYKRKCIFHCHKKDEPCTQIKKVDNQPFVMEVVENESAGTEG
jgi:hypothetical protein